MNFLMLNIELLLMQFFFFLAVLCTFISQMPILLGTTAGSVLKLSWILPFAFVLLKHTSDLYCKSLKYVYILLALFIAYCFLLQSVFDVEYLGADTYNMLLSLFICTISYSYWKHNRGPKNIKLLSFFVLIVSVYIGYNVYVSADLVAALDSIQYASESKNSQSTILLSSAIFGFIFFKPQRKIMQYCGYFFEIVLVLIMFLLKSRATILGFAFVLGYYLLKSNNKKLKRTFWFLCIGVAVYLASNPSLLNTVWEGIILAGRDSNNLNEISSGRYDRIFYLIEVYYKSFIFGIGCYYFDCMPLVMVLQYGVIGAGFVFVLLWKLGKQIYCLDRENPIFLCTFLLFGVFMLNSLFEAQSPFGPGAKCFLLWVFVGFTVAEKETSCEYRLV